MKEINKIKAVDLVSGEEVQLTQITFKGGEIDGIEFFRNQVFENRPNGEDIRLEAE